MTSAAHSVRIAILAGMFAVGAVEASMGGEGNSRTSSEIVDTTTRLRLVSEWQGAEDLQSRDRSRRGDDGYDDRHSGNRRGSDVPNSGSGSFNSGPGNSSDGRRGGDGSRGILPRDVRQEDRREDRHLDRRDNRQEDRRLDHRENRVANSGGELRGLDRAKHVADDHGQRGRENAGAVQFERGSRIERIERPERSGRN